MKQPFIIWTMRRTGGTSLGNAIAKVGDYTLEHEPFNWDRTFGSITKAFSNTRKNFDFLSEQLQEQCIDKGICVKHCYEVVGGVLNESLVEVFSEAGYKHIIWRRENELLRLLSLYTAKQTDVWGKHGAKDAYEKYLSGERTLDAYDIDSMMSHYKMCKKFGKSIEESLAKANVDYKELTFEKFYSGELEDRKASLKSICEWLEIPASDFEKTIDDCSFNLMKAGQNSSALYAKIPNIEKISETFSDYEVAY